MSIRTVALSAIAGALVSAPAFAQDVTGTVNINGFVSGYCRVVSDNNGSTFSDTWNLGELADTDGTLKTISAQTTAGDGIRIACSSIPDVSIEATNLVTGGAAPSGYTNTINYTAYADFDLVTPTTQTISVASGAAASTASLTNYLENASDNVVVRADTFSTSPSTDLLVAGSYSATITVQIDAVP